MNDRHNLSNTKKWIRQACITRQSLQFIKEMNKTNLCDNTISPIQRNEYEQLELQSKSLQIKEMYMNILFDTHNLFNPIKEMTMNSYL